LAKDKIGGTLQNTRRHYELHGLLYTMSVQDADGN